MNQFFRLKQPILGPIRFMVGFVILLVIVTIILPEFAKPDSRPQPICRNNLKQLEIAFRGFGVDINGNPLLISNTNSSAKIFGLVDARPTQFEAP